MAQTEAMKKAKAKYYLKTKENDEIQNKRKEYRQKYYNDNKEKINEKNRERYRLRTQKNNHREDNQNVETKIVDNIIINLSGNQTKTSETQPGSLGALQSIGKIMDKLKK